MNNVWKPFPNDVVPWIVFVVLGLSVAAILLAIHKPVRWPLRLVAVLAVIGVVLSGAAAVNEHYGYYDTVRGVFGANLDNQVDFFKDFLPDDRLVKPPAGAPLSTVWQPPATMPAQGSVTMVNIPGAVSGFATQDEWVYLPPAYLASPRAELPVLIMMAGQPGHPRDWFDGGKLAARTDAYAALHQGLAPVVVVVDNLGDPFANPGCVDSPKGNVQKYLAVDVPTWIKDNLQVTTTTTSLAVGGLSNGGTCALTLAVNYPDIYRTFVSISGEDEITLGDRPTTLTELFGGSQAAFDKVDPLTVMSSKKFPDTAGLVIGGRDDPTYLPQAKKVAAAGKAAGMSVTYTELPGGHDFSVWAAGYEQALPWLGTRLGLFP